MEQCAGHPSGWCGPWKRQVTEPSSFQLTSGDVHTRCVSLDVPPDTSARLYATLTPDERTRSARFQFERDQQRFIVARGVLRDLLGRYLQTKPSQLRFVYNAFGKPDLSRNSATDSNSISLTQPVLPSSPSPLPPTSALISSSGGRTLNCRCPGIARSRSEGIASGQDQ